jgi:aspartate/methionine/tyrosine aminotransferase
VNLGQGFPDFPAPDFIKEAAKRAIDDNRNQYAPAIGIPRLRAEIAALWKRRYAIALDPDTEITVTQGATEALFDATLAMLNPGDEAIVFEPFYDAYVPDIQMAGGVPRFVRLSPPDWRFRVDELSAAFSNRTRLLFLNTPQNPTGKVFTTGELGVIAELCQRHDVVVIADEVYSEISFDGIRHVPMATRPGMRARTITIDSIGKTFGVTGWKIGWAIAPPELTAALRGAHQFVTFCNSTPFQEAAADALSFAEASGYGDELRAAYDERRRRLIAILEAAGLPPLPVTGSYFLLSDISKWSFADDLAFCRHLVTEVGVAAIPPSVFYANPRSAPRLARFCFAKSDAALAEAAARLQRFSSTIALG